MSIASGSLSLIDGSQIQSLVREADSENDIAAGRGNAGNITIDIRDAVTLAGIAISNKLASGIFSKVGTFNLEGSRAIGNAGDINIQAKSLSVTDNAQIDSTTSGQGNAGNITISTDDAVELNNGTIASYVENKAIGNAGDINIQARSLSLANDSSINSYTNGQGNAGNITGNAGGIEITTKNLNLTNGGQIDASTFGQGNAGTVKITASDTISVNGESKDGFPSGIGSAVSNTGVGNAGGVEITTDKLSLTNGGILTVKSFGQGVAGNLFVQADSVTLKGGTISASTPLGEGGNVTLQVDDVLRLDNNSKISATATGEANGGNIDIDADTIVAFPNGNNDIVASAEKGNGGNINIKTEGIFGLKENPSTPENQTNDIDASSEFGFSGNVFINNPDVNPTKGIEQSPESVVEPDETVSQACSGSDDIAKENSFTIIGRGGMPESPTEPLKSTLLAGGTGAEKPRGGEAEKPRGGEASISLKEGKKTFSSDEVTPARGMTLNEKGQVVLTAYPTPNATASRSATNSINCSPKRQARANTNYIFPDNFLSGTN
jgi:large exoprotein involved in heme utilization and adhesion